MDQSMTTPDHAAALMHTFVDALQDADPLSWCAVNDDGTVTLDGTWPCDVVHAALAAVADKLTKGEGK